MAAPVIEASASRAARSAPGSDDGMVSGAGGVEPAAGGRGDDPYDPPEAAVERAGVGEIAQLRRKLEDLGAQQRKAHTAVQQLADSVAALVAAHRRRVRWLNLNSFAAYLIFTVLLGTAFYMVYLRRAGALAVEVRELGGQRDSAVRRADAAASELAVSKARSQKALEAFQLYGEGKATEAAARRAELGGALTPLEEAALEGVRERAARAAFDQAYGQGLAAFRAGNFAAAVEPLEQAVAVGGGKPGVAHYYLGMSFSRTGELPRAKAAFEAALAAAVEIEDARYQLATVLDRSGEVGRARTEYEKFATGHPKMILAVYAMRRSAVLARWGRAAPPLPGAAPAAGQAPTGAMAPAAGAEPAGQAGQWPARQWRKRPGAAGAAGAAGSVPPAGASPPAAAPAPAPAPAAPAPAEPGTAP